MSPDSPMNEQESWNKRFEMSLAEIYMELPDGHRAKKDYEALIAEPRGKMVEMSMRLDELEEAVRELKLKAPSLIAQPQPVATLCEEVEKFLRDYHRDSYPALRYALTAERKRAKLVDEVIIASRAIAQFNTEDHGIRFPRVRCALDALDAFDKGAV